MDIEKAILEIRNMITLFEDMTGSSCVVKIWASKDDIDALRMAVEALEEKARKGDDLK